VTLSRIIDKLYITTYGLGCSVGSGDVGFEAVLVTLKKRWVVWCVSLLLHARCPEIDLNELRNRTSVYGWYKNINVNTLYNNVKDKIHM